MKRRSKNGKVRFRSIEGLPGYLVGDNGTVWSRNHHKTEEGRRTGKWRKLGQRYIKSNGGKKYLVVDLRKDGKPCRFLVHRIVLEAFVGPCPEGMTDGCHFPDRDTTHNYLSNLRWGTRSDNMQDAIKHGTTTRGEKSGRAVLTERQVRKIRRLYAEGSANQYELAERYGVKQGTISLVITRKNWAWVK